MGPLHKVISVLFLGFAVASGVSAISVTVVNRTGDTLVEVYFSKDPSSWKTDVLSEGVMLNSERLRISVPGEAGGYYVKAKSEGGGEYQLNERQLKEGTTVVITAADMVKAGTVSGFPAKIVNTTGKTIHQISILPKGVPKGSRGESLLNEKEVLLQGEDRSVLFPAKHGTKIFTIQLVDEEGTSYLKVDVDVARETRIFFTAKDKK